MSSPASHNSAPTHRDRNAINFDWMIRLRWAAIAGQLIAIGFAEFRLHAELPLLPLLAIVGFAAATNAVCVLRCHGPQPISTRQVAAVTALDISLFTGLLYFTGGPFNPFSFLYLVYIALAAIILPPRYTWALAALSLLGSAILFVSHRELRLPAHSAQMHMTIHLQGMWVALGVAALFIVYFVMRVGRALAEREAELERARLLSVRQERLASLATLAAGAAHELSTPLSTIAMVAKELERRVSDPRAHDDVILIRSEVGRCRTILDQMSTEAGETAGEGMTETTAGALVHAAMVGLHTQPAVTINLGESGNVPLTLPERAVSQSLRGVIKNAQDATPADGTVQVRVVTNNGQLSIQVADTGAGMAPEVLARAGEPFFTSKEPGAGMGLGLFLTRTVFEKLGGSVELNSAPGRGTVATLTLPITTAAAGAAATSVHHHDA